MFHPQIHPLARVLPAAALVVVGLVFLVLILW